MSTEERSSTRRSAWGLGTANPEEPWRTKALCAQVDPEIFFPNKGESNKDAKKVCAGCEVTRECLEDALANDERFGIRGGLSERERKHLKTGRPRSAQNPTPAARPANPAPPMRNRSRHKEALPRRRKLMRRMQRSSNTSPQESTRRSKGNRMSSVSSHECLAGPACRAAQHTDNGHRGATTAEPDTLCPPCDKALRSAIQQLPRDWADLRNALGERSSTTGAKVRSTPTPAMPISARKQAMMADIVELADHAADIVSEQLNIQRSSSLRKPPAKAEEGSIAWTAAEHSQPEPQKTLAAAIALIEPNIDLLAAAPEQPTLAWKSPRRCAFHAAWIEENEHQLAAAMRMPGLTEAGPKAVRTFLRKNLKLKAKYSTKVREQLDSLNQAFRSAGTCETCGGWCKDGQARELVEHTGIDIALQLVELHHQARAELGLTRLRHRYPMPCPRCGGRVGRDDGETIITCDDRDGCKATWTECEYQFLVGLITHERLEMETLRLLDDSYSRLDEIRGVIDKLKDDGRIDLPGAGRIIAERIEEILDTEGTRPATQRNADDRKATEQRQTREDTWAWGNEPRYQRPRPKPKKATRPAGPPIHPGSLTTLVDIDETAALVGQIACPECNLTHRGDCA